MGDVIRRAGAYIAMAVAALLVVLLLLSAGRATVSGAARTAATNAPNLTALPLGSGKVTTIGPAPGFIFLCRRMGGGPAASGGPWINMAAGTYSLGLKPIVDGSNPWPNAIFQAKVKKKQLRLTGNGLPTDHNTGNFPVRPTDDAFQYDRNPNTVTSQTISFILNAQPRRLATPQCVGGQVGIARNGVPIFNALDAANQDAVAFEIQDACSGHPQMAGQYHYHGLPGCISYGSDARHSTLIGWAFDGFPIYGPIGNNGQYMRLSDLNECHGHIHKIKYQGEKQKLFHYHATHEFPYTVGCYRGTPAAVGP